MGEIILFFFLICVVISFAIFLNIRKKKLKEKHAALFELKGVVRVLDESLNLIANTKNIETLKSRVHVIQGCLIQMENIERRGFNLSTTTSTQIRHGMWDTFNNAILNLSEKEVKDILNKKDSYSSVKTAITAISKIQQKLIDFREALYQQGSNYTISKSKIQSLHDRLKEEIFIGQLKELIEKADKEDFKGNKKKAKDLYNEALHHLLTGGFDISKYTKEQKLIEDKISSLQ